MWVVRYAPAIVLGLLVFCLARWTMAAGPGVPYRLIDHATSGKDSAGIINGVFRRILDPCVEEYVFPLEGKLPRSVLAFSVGLAPAPESVAVRFEVSLRRASADPVTLYQRDVRAAGWFDERVDLTADDLENARLILRKKLPAGPKDQACRGFWGEPMLVATEPPVRPSVVLISLDTLRADRVGAYGYSKARTPALDAFARSAAVYTAAYSASTWTCPSHGSLLLGVLPAAFPAVDVSRFPTSVAAAREKGLGVPPSAFPSEPRPLPEILRGAGYLTAGFTGGGFMIDIWGFARGFDTFFMFEQPKAQPGGCSPDRFDGPVVFKRAMEWLRANRGHPFFLFIHTYDIHDRCPVQPPGIDPFGSWPDPGSEGRKKVLAHYDDLVARTDQLFGSLLRDLEASDQTKNVLVVVTSDHGEGFWEHGFHGHGCGWRPYEELVRVPLMFRVPWHRTEPRRIAAAVSAIDVAPTILKLIGEGVPPAMQGKALPGLGLTGERTPSEPIYTHCGDLLAIRRGRLKLLTSKSGALPDEVYDLERDGSEELNLLAKNPSAGRELRRWATAYWQMASPKGEQHYRASKELDASTRERLRALGYLE